jgi:uncharacterized protein YdhG (YjbR/CyaY superfamily)
MIHNKSTKTVAGYLAALPPDQRAALKRVRATVRAFVPGAVEVISYQMPAFRFRGRMLVYYAAASKHCSLFPGAYPIAQCKADLKGFGTSKGTVRFTPEKPLPVSLIRKLVRARIDEIKRQEKKKGRAN